MPSHHPPESGVDEMFANARALVESSEEVESLRAELAEQAPPVEPASAAPDHALDDVEIEIEIEQAAQAIHEIGHTLDEIAKTRPPHIPWLARPWLSLGLALVAGLVAGGVARRGS